MWQYEKKLQYPVKIANPNPKYAQIIISQFGGQFQNAGCVLILYLFKDLAIYGVGKQHPGHANQPQNHA